jgi:hypothetical protein
MIHFHSWDYFTDWQKDDSVSGGCVVHAQFRRCYTCHRWEREHSGWTDTWWAECLQPFGVEKLQLRALANAEMHQVRMEHDRWTVIDGH